MVLADTHVHIYPFADLDRMFSLAVRRLTLPGNGTSTRALFLTERYDCSFFREMCEGKRSLPPSWRAEPAADGLSACLTHSSGDVLWIVSGFQVVTSERVEVLTLATGHRIPDRLPLDETLVRARDAGAVPVLSWAPGKWFGPRGRLLADRLGRESSEAFLLGDTSLRPIGWGTPALMKQAKQKGFRLLAGSDPLPVPGDERIVGSLATRFDLAWNASAPTETFRRALRDPGVSATTVGRRGWPWTVGLRLAANERVRRSAPA